MAFSGEEEKRNVQMAVMRTTTPMMDENSTLAEIDNAIQHDKMKGPSEIVLTNLMSEDDHPGTCFLPFFPFKKLLFALLPLKFSLCKQKIN